MKCKKCGTKYNGDFCPNCGCSTDNLNLQCTQALQSNKKTKKLLGFRSNKVVNKIISIGYMIVCALVLIGILGTEKYVNITNYDYTISQICDSLIVVMMITPYIFLSDFKFRNKLPLFKNHTVKSNIIGMLIVITILGVISGILDANHSKEFLADRDNHDWKETVTEATCEKTGEKLKQCQYCGIKESEEIPKLKHEKEEISKTEPTCEKQGEIASKCKLCSKEFKEVLKATGHKFKEISRKEATETTEGEIVNECSVCKKQEKTVIEKLDKKETSNPTTSKKENTKDTSSKENSSKTEKTKFELTNYLGQTIRDIGKELNITFNEVADNDYLHTNTNTGEMIEVYTDKTGGINAIKLLDSGKANYSIYGITSSTKLADAKKALADKDFKSLGYNKWTDKSKKDIIMYSEVGWIYEKDSPLVSEKALEEKSKTEFAFKYSDSSDAYYIGNGQTIEVISSDFSELLYNYSQLTDYQKVEYNGKVKGRYVLVHGEITSVGSDGSVIVYCNDLNKKNNWWLSGTASAKIKLITQQLDTLITLNKGDEVLIFAKINSNLESSLLGGNSAGLTGGIIYSINDSKLNVPIIEESIDSLTTYLPRDYTLGIGFE